MSDFEVIDGFRCYSPAVARQNKDYDPAFFQQLFILEEKNFWFRARNNMIVHLLRKYLGNGRFNVLEIGCGTGYVLKGLSENFDYSLTGAEVFVEGLKFAKRRLPTVDFVQLDATQPIFSDQFHAVGTFDVLEHIEDDAKVMENIYNALLPGGYIFATVPQYQWMWSLEDDLAFHKRRYSKRELIQKLRATGFQIQFVGSFVFMLFPFMMLQRIIASRKQGRPSEVTLGLRLPTLLNSAFFAMTQLDVWAIKKGISLPWGGSLVVVGRKESKS